MAATPSNMIELGTSATAFSLPDVVSGNEASLEDLRGRKGTLIMFICNHCPFVKHINSKIVELGNEFIPKGINFIAISSNDANAYPEDGPTKMAEVAKALHYPFPYLYDENQEVAKAYNAACTPDFFLYDAYFKLVYRGQFDDSRPGNSQPVTGDDLKASMNALLLNSPIPPEQKPSIGCSIKWKK